MSVYPSAMQASRYCRFASQRCSPAASLTHGSALSRIGKEMLLITRQDLIKQLYDYLGIDILKEHRP
jgi:hypothetical protein